VPPNTLLWPLEPHTQAKHRVYKRYLQAWFPIMLSLDKGVTYAEGFAGPGEYEKPEPDSPMIPGSPIIAVRTLLRARTQPTSDAPAYLLLVDDNKARCAHLRGLLLAELGTLDPKELLRRGLVVDVQPGTCEEKIPETFRQHAVFRRPLLAIFDTWGSAVSFDLLSRVARVSQAEAVVTIQPGHFARFAKDPEHYGDNVFGSNLWREVQRQAPATKADYIRAHYRDTIHQAGFRFVLDFELADEGGHLLYLVYGTNHPKGIEKMKEAMWSVDPIRGLGYRDPRDPNQQTLDIEVAPQTGPLRRLILEHLERLPSGRATLAELRDWVLQETIYKPTHTRPAVQELIRAGHVQAGPGRLASTTTITLSGTALA
jgi:three-Cys-motif partner protein